MSAWYSCLSAHAEALMTMCEPASATKRFYDLKRHNKVVHNTKVEHYQNLTSQIDSENTNIQNLNKRMS